MDGIDAVITWVDGGDPAHVARLQAYLAETGGARPAAADPTRFNDDGELEYCLASIRRFAPWIGRIFIVTDRQVPALLARLAGSDFGANIRVVDHAEIFAGHERHLPTFNSRAIITALWRIEGLAEREAPWGEIVCAGVVRERDPAQHLGLLEFAQTFLSMMFCLLSI